MFENGNDEVIVHIFHFIPSLSAFFILKGTVFLGGKLRIHTILKVSFMV